MRGGQKKFIFFINFKVHTKISRSKQKHIIFVRFYKSSCLLSELDQLFRIFDHEHKLAKKNLKNHQNQFIPTGLNMGEMINNFFKFFSENVSSTRYFYVRN